MQAGSHEIVRAKELEAMSMPNANANTNVDAAKIAAVVIQNACVGDAEDLKYTAFVVESINKKSSKNFQMTGLTGTTNGHFGSESSEGLASVKGRECSRNNNRTISIIFILIL